MKTHSIKCVSLYAFIDHIHGQTLLGENGKDNNEKTD